VLGLAIQCVGTILENAFHPFIEEEPGAVDELIQHTRWKEVRQFQLEMMDQVLIYANGLNALSISRQERNSFRQQCESDNNARAINIGIRLPKSSDNAIPSPFCGSEVYKENLIVVMVDHCA
jgi:hypothetical protein